MDNLGDMLIQIKNAGNAGNKSVTVSFSKFKNAVATELLRLGYVAFLNKKSKKGFPAVEIGIAYEEWGIPKIKGLKRISKLSRRIYHGIAEIKPVRQGYGDLFLSTPRGIMTGKEALKERVGGEALFKIW